MDRPTFNVQRLAIYFLVFAFLTIVFANNAKSQSPFDEYYSPEKNEYSGYTNPDEFIKSRIFKEGINTSNGALTLFSDDLNIPGRSGENLEINRRYRSNVWNDPGDGIETENGFVPFNEVNRNRYGQLQHPGPFGLGWDFLVGEARIYLICSDNSIDCAEGVYESFDAMSWIMLDNGSRYEIAWRYDKKSFYDDDPDTLMVKEKPEWKLILNKYLNDEWHPHLILILDDGTKYYFNRTHNYSEEDPSLPVPRWIDDYRFMVTKIEDTNGNFIKIFYYNESSPGQEDTEPIFIEGTGNVENLRIVTTITDNCGRTAKFNVVREWHRDYLRYYVNQLDYIGFDGQIIRVKYDIDPLFNTKYGFYSDPYLENQVHNTSMVLESIATYTVDEFEHETLIAPPVTFDYCTDYGVLTAVHYRNEGSIYYDYARILDDYTTGETNYGYMRLISKTVEIPALNETEEWFYYYGSDNNYDTYTADLPDYPASIQLETNSSVGNMDGLLEKYLPNYRNAKIVNPIGDSTVYYYYDEYDTPPGELENPYIHSDYVGVVDSVFIYDSEENKLISRKHFFYDRCPLNIAKAYFDQVHDEYRDYYYSRLLAKYNVKGNAADGEVKYCIQNLDFIPEYEIAKTVKDHGEIHDVSWNNDPMSHPLPSTGEISIETNADQKSDIRTEEKTFIFQDRPEYKNKNMLHLVQTFIFRDNSPNIIGNITYDYDEYEPDEWSPPGDPPDFGWNSFTDEYRGNLTSLLFDNLGDLPDMQINFYYDEAGNVIKKVTSPDDPDYEKTITYEYDLQYQRAYLTKFTIDPDDVGYDGLNLSKTYSFDFNTGKLTEETDYNGNTATRVYDNLLRFLYVDLPDAPVDKHSYEFIYDDDSNLHEITCKFLIEPYDGSGTHPPLYKIDKYFVDMLGRIRQTQQIDDSYNTSIVSTNEFWYDKLVRITTKPVEITRTTGDPFSSAATDSVKHFYDALGRNIETEHTFINYPNPDPRHITSQQFNYDYVIIADENGNTIKNTYQGRDRVANVSWGDQYQHSVTYDYDAFDRLISVTDADGKEYSYSYDGIGRLIRNNISERNGTPTGVDRDTLIYRPDGLLIFTQDPNRESDPNYGWQYYIYDKADRVIETGFLIALGSTSPDYTLPKEWLRKYSYDSYDPSVTPPLGLDNPLNQMTKMISKTIDGLDVYVDSTIFFYNSRGNIGEKWVGINDLNEIKKISYTHNEAGLVDTVLFQEGLDDEAVIIYEHNTYGLVSKAGNEIIADKYATFSYNPSLNIESLTLGPSSSYAQIVDYEYNLERDLLTAINNGTLSPDTTGNGDHYSEIITYFSGGYNGAAYYSGLIASAHHENSYGLDRLIRYEYDTRNRLLNAIDDQASAYNETFNYGNYHSGRISSYIQGQTTYNYAYESDSYRLDQITGLHQTDNYGYDASGNLIRDDSKNLSLTLNYKNLPEKATIGLDELKFRYDANDKRIVKEHNPDGGDVEKTFYIYSGDKALAEYRENGSLKDINIYAGDKLVAHRHYSSTNPCVVAQNCRSSDPNSSCHSGNCEWVEGDVNGDGLCISSDVTYLVSYFMGTVPAPFPVSRGDVSGDGALIGSDVTYLVNYFLGMGPPPVCCYWTCGYLYYHIEDHLGSTRVLTDSTGRMFAGYDYFSTGEKTDQTWVYRGSDYQYIENEYDEESGFNLGYFSARYYDSKANVFTSMEPLLLGMNPCGKVNDVNLSLYLYNPYTYSANNPIICKDPNGEILAVVGFILFIGTVIYHFDIVIACWDEFMEQFGSDGSIVSDKYDGIINAANEGDEQAAQEAIDAASELLEKEFEKTLKTGGKLKGSADAIGGLSPISSGINLMLEKSIIVLSAYQIGTIHYIESEGMTKDEIEKEVERLREEDRQKALEH